MRLRRYLKSSVKPALFLSLFLFFSILGCSTEIEPSYKEKDLSLHIKKICKEEYDLDVITRHFKNTIWIYAPLPRIISKDYAQDKTKLLDEEMVEKLRNILITIGRVILSADKVAEFYCLIASDISEVGVDYTLIGYTQDTKKSYAGFIPWTENNRRYVIRIELNPKALGDTTGRHIWLYDITLEDFLAKQIAQRIRGRFQDDELKDYFQVDNVAGRFDNGTFYIEYAIKNILELGRDVDIQEEMLRIIAYVIQTYEFDNFSLVELQNLLGQEKLIISKPRIKDFKLP